MAASLANGGVRILVAQDDRAKGRDRVKGEGFSMQLTTPDDPDGFRYTISSEVTTPRA